MSRIPALTATWPSRVPARPARSPKPPSVLPPRWLLSQIRVDQVGHAVGESGTAYLMTARPAPHTGWAVVDGRGRTVLSGSVSVGFGSKVDQQRSTHFPTGSFYVNPAGAAHYVWTREGTTVQITGLGPWQLTYLDPDDDPRKPKTPAK